MIRLFSDFNDRTEDGACWNLFYNGTPLEETLEDLNLREGDKVILCQDQDDFEVMAVLYFRYVDVLNKNAWVAIPDWSTISRNL